MHMWQIRSTQTRCRLDFKKLQLEIKSMQKTGQKYINTLESHLYLFKLST